MSLFGLQALSGSDDDVVVLSCGDDGNMSVWDARSGAVSTTFKNCLAANQGVISVDGRPARTSRPVSSALIAAQRDKPFLNVWHWGKDQVQLKCAAPEKVLSLAVTSDGGFLFAGTPSGKIYVWEVCVCVSLLPWYSVCSLYPHYVCSVMLFPSVGFRRANWLLVCALQGRDVPGHHARGFSPPVWW